MITSGCRPAIMRSRTPSSSRTEWTGSAQINTRGRSSTLQPLTLSVMKKSEARRAGIVVVP
jgi:hypothetical protein